MGKNQLSLTYYSQNLFVLSFWRQRKFLQKQKANEIIAFYIKVDNIIIHCTYLSHHIHPHTASKRILIQMTPIKKEGKNIFSHRPTHRFKSWGSGPPVGPKGTPIRGTVVQSAFVAVKNHFEGGLLTSLDSLL